MAEQTPEPSELSLPEQPNIDWLRKQAKRRLAEIRESNPDARLSDAQFDLAKRYGFTSWRVLKAYVDSQTIDGRLFDAARNGDARRLAAMLDEHPDHLYARTRPYGLTLLHLAAHNGHAAVVELLLARGLDVNVRDKGDDTTAMHWAAAGGHLEVVRTLADAGGDVIGRGDDHELGVIGWATCWEGGDDDAHRAVAEFLVRRGARHHIFSAIALDDADAVRRIVAADPGQVARPMSRSDNHRLPLHFAILRNRPAMVALLLELGADPAATDGLGASAAVYASDPDIDRGIIGTLTDRGVMGLFGALAAGDAEPQIAPEPGDEPGGNDGVLHLTAKRGDVRAVRWLLERGADPTIRDSKHDGDARGWAEFGRVPPAATWREVARMLDEHAALK